MIPVRSLLAWCAVSLAMGCAGTPAPPPGPPVRGINLSLDQPPRRGIGDLGPAGYARIRAGGFTLVRLPVRGFRHMDAANRLDPAWLSALDRAVDDALGAGLTVILDEHDFRACGEDPEGCTPRLLAFWAQVAPRYAGRPGALWFELLNEPGQDMTPARWNALLAHLLPIVRASNPVRTVVVGPANANSPRSLDALVLPADDRHLVVDVHSYDPFRFTHQGASWTRPSRENDIGHRWGSPAEVATVRATLAGIAAWGRTHRRPMLLGEFGTYEKADMADRALWTATVARAAEANGIPWAYWQFDHDFAAWDAATGRWVQPIHDALVPPSGAVPVLSRP